MTSIDALCVAVEAALPGQAHEITARLGLTHEQVYAALVRLNDRRSARFESNHGRVPGVRGQWVKAFGRLG